MTESKVLWVNLKGADWALIQPLFENGKMPNLAALIAKGSYGQIFSVPPRRYPSSTTTLATGAEPQDHRIVAPVFATDDTGIAIRPVGPGDWARSPVWDVAAAAGRKSFALGWPGTHPAASAAGATVVSDAYMLAQGTTAEEWPMDPDCVTDETLLSPLAGERLHPKEVKGDMLRGLLGALDTIDLKNDERIKYLVEALSRTFSLHRAACWMVTRQSWDLFAVHFELLDHLSQFFVQYQDPRMGHVTTADHARYAGVVDGAYAYVDRMLAPYVRAADAVNANVVITSDHGYLTGDLRKRPAALNGAKGHLTYRDAGIFAVVGPAFQQGRNTSGVTSVSVAPTILAALGCAPLPSMGPVIQDVMTTKPRAAEVQEIPAIRPQNPSEDQAKRALAYLERRDLLPPMPKDREARLEVVQCSQLTRLAQCNIAAKQYDVALEQLAEVQVIAPSAIEAHVLTAQCSVAVADWDRATQSLDALDLLGVELPMALYFRARVAAAEGNTAVAREHLEAAEELVEETAEGCKTLESIGTAYFDMQAAGEAARTFERALKIDARAPRALSGLGTIHLATQDFEKALTCFQGSLSALQKQPTTQALRGQALQGLGQLSEARSAFETALAMAPNLAIAQEGLAQLADKEAAAAFDIIQTGKVH